RWRTGVETNLLGFNVFRGLKRVNGRLVQARGRARGALYSFLDRSALGSRAYTYRLQAVGMDGSKRWRGTVRVAARRLASFSDLLRSLVRVASGPSTLD